MREVIEEAQREGVDCDILQGYVDRDDYEGLRQQIANRKFLKEEQKRKESIEQVSDLPPEELVNRLVKSLRESNSILRTATQGESAGTSGNI